MVTTRKPKSNPAAKRRSPAKRAPDSKRGAPRKRETLEAKFQRVLSEPVDAPIEMTKHEARYFLRRLWETGDPNSRSGVEVMNDFYRN